MGKYKKLYGTLLLGLIAIIILLTFADGCFFL